MHLKKTSLLLLLAAQSVAMSVPVFAQEQAPVSIQVDLSKTKAPMKPIWAWFGYDEPNYTYMKDGKNC